MVKLWREGATLRETRYQLANFDIVNQVGNVLPAPVVQIVFGLGCTLLMSVARSVVDVIAPTAGPFALIYPVTLIATLYGRWLAGLVTAASAFLWTWYFVLPDRWSFHFARPGDPTRMLVNVASVLIVLAFAEVFRQAVRTAGAARDAELKQSALLLREIDHRTKNNFMIVASLLDLQRRRQTSPEARAALEAAAGRIHSFAAANQALYEGDHGSETLSMAPYLTALTAHIGGALFLPDSVTLTIDADDAQLPRDQAVPIGVVLNEVVTNAAKHAFGPEQQGRIEVLFKVESNNWTLKISDNGRGFANNASSSGLGSTLIEAFAARAGGIVETTQLNPGTSVSIHGTFAAK